MQQQVDDPPYLSVGTEVSAKYKGAFCEAKVRKVDRNIKCKVAYKQGLGSGTVTDDQIKGDMLRVGATVEVRHPDKKEYVEATITKIQDSSQYTVVFDDGDITTLRRSALCLKSGRHFNESETLDQLPLTHPEHFGNPVIGGRRGRRSRHNITADDSSEEDEEPINPKQRIIEKEEHIGKVVCVENTETKKKASKENWFPALVVAPTAQDAVRIRVKDEYLVRSFKDGRYYTVPKKEAMEFSREKTSKSDAVQAALEYLNNDSLPTHWDRDVLFALGTGSSDSDGDEDDSDTSDDEPREEKDHFVAQLYKYMDDRGTPLNKGPSIINKDVDLYRLFRAVQKLGGYNKVTSQSQWKQIATRLGYTPTTISIQNLVKQAYKKFLLPFEEFDRKLGCTMVAHPRANRIKGRSLVRANSVASPKPEKDVKLSATAIANAAAAAAAADESENTSESGTENLKVKRKLSTSSSHGKVKALIEKYEEKHKEEVVVKDAAKETTAITSVDVKEEKKETVVASSSSSTSSNSSTNSGNCASSSSSTSSNSNTHNTKQQQQEQQTQQQQQQQQQQHQQKEIIVKKSRESKELLKDIKLEKDLDLASSSSIPTTQQQSPAISSLSTSTRMGLKTLKEDPTIISVAVTSSTTTISVASVATTLAASTTSTSSSSIATTTTTSASSSTHTSPIPQQRKDKQPKRIQTTSNILEDRKSATKKRKTELEPEKSEKDKTIDTAASSDFPIEIGHKLKVFYHEQKVTYEAKVIEISQQQGKTLYLVHYTGWNTRYDEWVPKERIAENLTNNKTNKRAKTGGSAAPGSSTTTTATTSSSSSSTTITTTTSSTTSTNKSNEQKCMDNRYIGASTSSSNANGGSGGFGSVTGSGGSGGPSKILIKRGRGGSRGESQPPRSTTPSSVASNSSQTKSPATPATHRRTTRGQPNSNRRTSNNTDISSLQTDTDSDSDEPVKKQINRKMSGSRLSQQTMLATASTSTAHSIAGTGIGTGAKSNSNASSEEESGGGTGGESGSGGGGGSSGTHKVGPSSSTGNTKGRDFDLNQIRSELKGFSKIKSPSPDEDLDIETEKKFDFAISATSNTESGDSISQDITKAVTSDSKTSSDTSSESDSYGDDDSQFSDKTTQLENISEKLQEKFKAGKLDTDVFKKTVPVTAMAVTSSSSTVAPTTATTTTSVITPSINIPTKRSDSSTFSNELVDKVATLKASGIEKIIKNSLADKSKMLPDKLSMKALCERSPLKIEKERAKEKEHLKDSDAKLYDLPKSLASTSVATISTAATTIKSSQKVSQLNSGSDILLSPSSSSSTTKTFGEKLTFSQNLSEKTILSREKLFPNLASAASLLPPPSQPSSSSSSSSSSQQQQPTVVAVKTSSIAITKSQNISTNTIIGKTAASVADNKDQQKDSSLISDIYEFKEPEPFEFETCKKLSPDIDKKLKKKNVSEILELQKPVQVAQLPITPQPPVQQSMTTASSSSSPSPSSSSITPPTPTTTHQQQHPQTTPSTSGTPAKKQKKHSPKEDKIIMKSMKQADELSSTRSDEKSLNSPTKISPPKLESIFDSLRKSPSFNLTHQPLSHSDDNPPMVSASLSSAPSSSMSTLAFSSSVIAKDDKKQERSSFLQSQNMAKPTFISSFVEAVSDRPKKISDSKKKGVNNDKDSATIAAAVAMSSDDVADDDKPVELETVKKILLSEEIYEPPKIDKPSSIADKVLKALNQHQQQQRKSEEKDSEQQKLIGTTSSTTTSTSSKNLLRPIQSTSASYFASISVEKLFEPITTSPISVGGGGGLTVSSSSLLPEPPKIELPALIKRDIETPPKKPVLSSPEHKIDILESIAPKNNDLSETIQKLESVIQQRVDLNNLSDESSDSTDSEQRLVIEDESLSSAETQNDLSRGSNNKLDTSTCANNILSLYDHHSVKLPPTQSNTSAVHQSSLSLLDKKEFDSQSDEDELSSIVSNANLSASSFSSKYSPASGFFASSSTTNDQLKTNTQMEQSQGSANSVGGGGVVSTITTNANTSIGIKNTTEPLSIKTAVDLAAVSSFIQPSDMLVPPPIQQVRNVQRFQHTSFSVVQHHQHTTPTTSAGIVDSSGPQSQSKSEPTKDEIIKQQQLILQPQQQQSPSTVQTNVKRCILFSDDAESEIPATRINKKENSPITLSPSAPGTTSIVYQHSSQSSISTPMVSMTIPTNTIIAPILSPTTTHITSTQATTTAAAAAAATTTSDNKESLSLLLCEETIPGSPTPPCPKENIPTTDIIINPVITTAASVLITTGGGVVVSSGLSNKKQFDNCMFISPPHPTGADIKSVPMDIETSITSPAPMNTNVVVADMKIDGQIQSQLQQQQSPHSSPRDSFSHDDSSEDVRKRLEGEIASVRKRRHSKKISESEGQSLVTTTAITATASIVTTSTSGGPLQSKRRKGSSRRNTATGSDSEDNLEYVQSSKSSGSSSGQRPKQQCQFNFLVQLDPALSSNQRIAILNKKIQDLRKTYNIVKAELASIDRRRKKLRRRERENKKNQLKMQNQC